MSVQIRRYTIKGKRQPSVFLNLAAQKLDFGFKRGPPNCMHRAHLAANGQERYHILLIHALLILLPCFVVLCLGLGSF